ncbi:MAG: Alcohol dehydrogenase zinc-binding domain protein [Subtercola sp.]|nr:Alcohol dehydrogenase zinc-binding domain protein [Subtercola sp.]
MPRVVVFDEFGGPDVLRIVDDPVVEPQVGEVRVRIEAFAINPLDAMMRSGAPLVAGSLPHARLGVEATGVIDAIGLGVVGFGLGDAVIITAIADAGGRGAHAEYTTIAVGDVIARPSELDVVAAAAIWVGFSTAYGALVELARLHAGDTVLITAASGSVGRAAIQVARALGAVPIAITRGPGKSDELLAAGAESVIVESEENIVDTVHRHTNGAGVDVVLDLVRGPGQSALLHATRTGGTLVEAGFLDERPTPQPADERVTVVGYRGFEYLAQPEVIKRMEAFLHAGVQRGILRPAIDQTFDLDHIVDAHRRFDEGLHAGKKIIVVP